MTKRKDYFMYEIKLNEKKNKIIKSDKYYKILFIFSGKCHFQLNNKIHKCGTDNIILINPNNDLTIDLIADSTLIVYKLIFTEELLLNLSDKEVNFLESFNTVPFEYAIIDANAETTMLIKNILKKLIYMKNEDYKFADHLYIKNMISIILILTLRECINVDSKQKIKRNKQFLIDDIFIYINNNITEEISLQDLEKKFYVSKFHISREFKKATGLTLHSYIVKAKLDLCKKLIEEGKPIVDVSHICGLGSYNNLFRAFKKEFGITPKEYYSQIKKYK